MLKNPIGLEVEISLFIVVYKLDIKPFIVKSSHPNNFGPPQYQNKLIFQEFLFF